MRHIRDLYVCGSLSVLRRLASNTMDLIHLAPPFISKKRYVTSVSSEAEEWMFDNAWWWGDLDAAMATKAANAISGSKKRTLAAIPVCEG